jgi:polyvinyl alcohol dehydrogenase (cytochrome)
MAGSRRRLWLALALGTTLAACEREAPPPEPEGARPAPPPVDIFAGATGAAVALYRERCASCHEGGVAGAAHAVTFQLMRPEGMLDAMAGVMAPQAEGLSGDQRLALAEFLTGQKLQSEPVAACAEGQSPFDFRQPPPLDGWGFGPGNRRFVDGETAGLGAADLPRLRVKWAFAYPNATRARSQPTVAGGAVFVGSQDGTVYALDAASGCARWTFRADGEVRTAVLVEPWSAGDTAARPSAYVSDADGKVYRLDAQTGAPIWSVEVDEHPNAVISGTPTLHAGRLYVPMSSTEWAAAADPAYECCTFRGSVTALDAASGKMLWRTYTIPSEPRLTGDTNPAGTPTWHPAGAPIWNSPTVDAARGRLYVGTGQSYTSPAAAASDAVLALDMETGKLLWQYQATAGDAWNMACTLRDRANCPAEAGPDFDIGGPPILLRLPAGKDIVLAGQKSGTVHALDAETGHAIWRRKVGAPGVGSIQFGMAADAGVVYVPIKPQGKERIGSNRDRPPGLFALDAVTGEQLWFSPAEAACPPPRDPRCAPGLSAPVTAVPGVVFAGGLDGWLRAFDMVGGGLLWSFDTAQPFATPDGRTARGGSIDTDGAVIAGGRLYVNSGHLYGGGMAGNLLLAFEIGPEPATAPAP